MGLNLVIACGKHMQSRWISRGEEQEGVTGFYRRHWRCNLDEPGSIRLGDDQGEGEFWLDPPWDCEQFWGPPSLSAATRGSR